MGIHTTHEMHDNSLRAYGEEAEKLQGRKRLVFCCFLVRGPMTDRECQKVLEFDAVAAVQPRISDLINDGLLAEVGSKKSETGKMVRLVDVKK